jgi:two-component system LytT family response regulator
MLIDDDKNCRQLIKAMLEKDFPMLDFSLEASNIKDAVSMCDSEKPELVFLDIDLKDGTGFDFLELVRHTEFKIIFTTAYNEFAVQAFKVNAVDYVMKPIRAEDIKSAVIKVFEKENAKNQAQQLNALIYNLNKGNSDKKLAIPTLKGFEFVSINELIRCEAADNYTYFYLTTGDKILVSKTLMEYERLLSNYHFFRVHQSNLINLRMIKNYQKGEVGMLIMADNSHVEVSRRKKAEFLKVMNEFAILPR